MSNVTVGETSHLFDCPFRKNPTFHLNYSLALYRAGDRRAASEQFKSFEQNFTTQQGEVDPEVRGTAIITIHWLCLAMSFHH